jgi:hypothetical protein
MKLPELKNTEQYTGLYVVDFGETSSVGFTAEEVAELLDSQKFAHIKVYKIHNAYPDGKLELKGVVNDTFQLETGMFFYAAEKTIAEKDYKRLIGIAVSSAPPSRAKVHLAKYEENSFVTAIIFPAEYNDEFSTWLIDADYKTRGEAAGGTDAVKTYYEQSPEVIERHQLLGQSQWHSKTGVELLLATKIAVQR